MKIQMVKPRHHDPVSPEDIAEAEVIREVPPAQDPDLEGRDETTDAGTAWEEPPAYHTLDVPGLLLFDVMSLWICGKFYAALDWLSGISARIRSWTRSRK